MSGSIHNVEVYRCTGCNEQVALSPEGFTLSEDELNATIHEHAQSCAKLRERMERAQNEEPGEAEA